MNPEQQNNPETAAEIARLMKAIDTLERKRDELGSEIVDTAIEPLREKLELLENTSDLKEKKLRKYVTVLFADISNFTEICGFNDAENVTEALNHLWTSLDSIIIRHGGVIDKHIGDAVMALWGTETVRENDTENAIKAALEMQAASGNLIPDTSNGIPGFRMRIGVHSGSVFLSNVGIKKEYTAMGDTVNIASRLQSAAPLGSVIVSHDAYRHVRADFVFEAQKPIKVKGIADPLNTYVVVSANPGKFRDINTRILGIATRMIGRDEELGILTGILNKTMLENSPRMVTVIGEAGIGKSRLLNEFRNKTERDNIDTVFFNARCTPEMKNMPCSVFRDILRYRMNVRENDSTEEAIEKFKAGMNSYLSENEIYIACHYAGFDFSESEPVRKLIGTEALAATGQSCLVRYFRGTSADNRTLIYLEDLHWADNTSLELIERLIRDITSGKLLILALTRPPLLVTHPEWCEGLPHRFMKLKPLSVNDSGKLVREILTKVDDIPSDITELIISSSEGNPFYVEELIAMLVEEAVIIPGKDKWKVKTEAMKFINIPSTLTGVLQARLDSLPENERELLQKASVIGRLFWNLTVEKLYRKNKVIDIDSMLSCLQARDLVYGSDDSMFSSAREYLFKHAILRDVTYDTVLLELRKVYHRNVAEWLVNNCGNRISELAGLIAEHFYRGGDRDNAVKWLSRSGTSAYSTSSYREALNAFQRALSLVPEDSPELPQLHFGAGEALEKLARYDEAREQTELARAEAETFNDLITEAKALLLLAWIAILKGELDRAKEISDIAYKRAEESGNKSILARAIMRIADFDEERTYEKKLSYLRRSYKIYLEIKDSNGIAITRLNMGNIAMHFNKYDNAFRYYRESLKEYESLGNQWGIANCLGNLGNVSYALKDYSKSRELHERSLALSTSMGDGEGEVICSLNLGRDAGKLTGREESLKYYSDALSKAASLGLVPLALSTLFEIAKSMIEENKPLYAALAILFIKAHEDSFYSEGLGEDIDGTIADVLKKLPESEAEDLRSLASSISLDEIAEKISNEVYQSTATIR